MKANDVTKVQIIKGSDAGAISCRLNEQQRAGRACLVCDRETGPDSSRARVGFVGSEPVFVHTYCAGAWQRGVVRER